MKSFAIYYYLRTNLLIFRYYSHLLETKLRLVVVKVFAIVCDRAVYRLTS